MTVQEYLSRNPGSIFDAQLVATDPSPAVLADFNRGQGTAPGLPPRIEPSSVQGAVSRPRLFAALRSEFAAGSPVSL